MRADPDVAAHYSISEIEPASDYLLQVDGLIALQTEALTIAE